MPTLATTLVLSEQLLAGLRDGSLYRDGGVVRDAHGRIVALLHDAETGRLPADPALNVSVVPLLAVGLAQRDLVRRLEALQAEVEALRADLREVQAAVDLVGVRLDAQVLGAFFGRCLALALDQAAGRAEMLAAHRTALLETYGITRHVCHAVVAEPKWLARFAGPLQSYTHILQLAGVLAVEVTRTLDGPPVAFRLATEVAKDAKQLTTALRVQLARPSALFWLEATHRALGRELAESSRRLVGHAEVLRLAPTEALQRLATGRRAG